MTKTRITYLSQLFDPEPTFKGQAFVASIEDNGLDAEVVTGFPNYPGGKIYDGFRIKAFVREKVNDTSVVRLAMYPSHDRSALKRIMSYGTFFITSTIYMLFFMRRTDVIYVYFPILTAGLAAAIVKLFRRTPFVIDIQDMWPESLIVSKMITNKVIIFMIEKLCMLVYKYCDHIAVQSLGFKSLLVERGVDPDKITVVYNWTQEAHLPAVQAQDPTPFQDVPGNFNLLFAGNLGTAQDLETIVKAAEKMQNFGDSCTFHFMGEGVEKEKIVKLASELALENVRFLPRVPLDAVQQYLTRADALLVHLCDDLLFRVTIPSKTQAYLYAGRPILIGVRGDAADLVEQAGAGYAFEPSNPDSLVEKLRILIADGQEKRAEMGKNGHTYYTNYLSQESGLNLTLDIVQKVTAPK